MTRIRVLGIVAAFLILFAWWALTPAPVRTDRDAEPAQGPPVERVRRGVAPPRAAAKGERSRAVTAEREAHGLLVRGVVVDAGHRPVWAGLQVEARFDQEASGSFASVRTDRNGAFAIRVPEAQPWSDAWPADSRTSEGGIDWPHLARKDFTVVTTSKGLEASPPALVHAKEARSSLFLVLHLRPYVAVHARAVDTAGVPVPRAEIRLVHWRDHVGPRWEGRYFLGGTKRAIADRAGRIRVAVPEGGVRAWARRPNGRTFGRPARGTATAARALDLGDLVVGSRTAEHHLIVQDRRGAPLANAAVRIDVEHAVQRFLPSPRGDVVTHYRTAADGSVSFLTESGNDPVVVGICAHGHVPLTAILPGAGTTVPHRLRLRTHPVLRFQLVADGRPVRERLALQVFERAEDLFAVGPRRDRHVATNVDPDAVAQLDMDDLPVGSLGTGRPDTPAFDPGTSTYSHSVRASGRHTLRVQAGPGVWIGGEATTGSPPVELPLPAGRLIEVDHAALEDVGWAIWAASASLPPSDWPATEAELLDARRSGFALTGMAATVWLPRAATHLAAGPLRDSVVTPPFTRQTSSSRFPLPGLVRKPGSALQRPAGPFARFEASARGIRLTVPHPRLARPPENRTLEIQVVVRGAPLRIPGIRVRYRGLTRRAEVGDARTDDSGRVALAVPAGVYRIAIAPGSFPEYSHVAQVPPTGARKIDVEFGGPR